ncbi:hypothetical protein PoMZ_00379 [Pyricularia oryzae]|uniref:Uncharacterized protein n=1 Tax=Pyricularia oryzae TaxID=318829 RepID=A0A4P7N3A1_PYROR|nr:hypothetical protein PoMZ_00379 [Pyricularia oryzae]
MWEICMWDPHDQTGPLGRKELRGNFHKGITPREIVKQIRQTEQGVVFSKNPKVKEGKSKWKKWKKNHQVPSLSARYSLLYGYGTMGDNEVTDPGWI